MQQTYFLGGYTKRVNKGISSVTFDPSKTKFGPVIPVSALNNPTWLTLNENKDTLFAISKADKGGLTVLKKDANGIFITQSECFATEIPGCHISYHEATRTVYVSNYNHGSIDIYRYRETGELSFIEQVTHSGSSVHKNQQSPHVHMTLFSKDQSQLYVCDLGTDEVYVYDIQNDGLLSEFSVTKFPAGTGPRHITLHPTLDVAYVIGELGNTTSVVRINEDKTLTVINTIPNVDASEVETSAGAAIRITQDGQFLYCSTRFSNLITAFKVDSVGMLSEIQRISTYGEIPRDFILDETEKFLLIPHQDTDMITVLNRDTKSGLLKKAKVTALAPECVNIVLA